MSVKPIHHYAMENPASVYDEEALTALELAARTAGKVNECVKTINEHLVDCDQHHAEQDQKIQGMYDVEIPKHVNTWLDDHPEATTTVQDGALTEPKFHPDFIGHIKNGYITPQTYGYTEGDVTTYLQTAVATKERVYIPAGVYTLSGEVCIPSGVEVYFANNAEVTLTGTGKIVLDRFTKVHGGRFLGHAVDCVFEMRSTTQWMQNACIIGSYIGGNKEKTTAIKINTTSPYSPACYCVVDNVHISGCRYGIIPKTEGWSNAHKFDLYCVETTTAIDLCSNGCKVSVRGQCPTTPDVPVIISGTNNIVECSIFDTGKTGWAPYAVELTATSDSNKVTEFTTKPGNVVNRGSSNQVITMGESGFGTFNRPATQENNMLTCAVERELVTFTYNDATVAKEENLKYLFHYRPDRTNTYFTIQPGGSVIIDIKTDKGVYTAGIQYYSGKNGADDTDLYYSTDGLTFAPAITGKKGGIKHMFGYDGRNIIALRFIIRNPKAEAKQVRVCKIFAVGNGSIGGYIPTEGGYVHGKLEFTQGNHLVFKSADGTRWGLGVANDGSPYTWKF